MSDYISLNGHAADISMDEFDDIHVGTSLETPVRTDAFLMSDEAKMKKIRQHFKSIMEILGLDLNDDSLKGTPRQVAKMYVKEIFRGLDPENKPAVTTEYSGKFLN